MKNRYLLLVTIIAGVAGQTAQAADTVEELRTSEKWPTVSQSIWNVLSQHPAITKPAALLYAPPARLTQNKQMRKDTYQKTRSLLSQYNIKPEYANWHLKTAESLILAEGKKYDPDFASRFKSWGIGNSWGISSDKTYNAPGSCITDIIKNGPVLNSENRAIFHHERGHDYLDHHLEEKIFFEQMKQKENFYRFYQVQNKKEFLQISNRKELLEDLVSLHRLCVEQEKQADAFVPDEPALLAAGAKFFTFHAQNSTEFYTEHPSDKQRAEYFKNRFKTVTKLQTKEEVDNSIASYANDFHIPIEHSTNSISEPKGPSTFPDEYSVYLALEPIVLRRICPWWYV